MDAILIPHAESAYLDRQSEASGQILVVETNLTKDSSDRTAIDARYTMMEAIAREVQTRSLDAYEIRWCGA